MRSGIISDKPLKLHAGLESVVWRVGRSLAARWVQLVTGATHHRPQCRLRDNAGEVEISFQSELRTAELSDASSSPACIEDLDRRAEAG